MYRVALLLKKGKYVSSKYILFEHISHDATIRKTVDLCTTSKD